MTSTSPASHDGDWRFLLDELEPGPVAPVVDPSDAELDRSIAGDAATETVVVCTTTRRRARRVVRILADRGFEHRTYGCWPSWETATLFVELARRDALIAAVDTVKNARRRRIGGLAVRLGFGPALFRHRTIVARRSSAVVPAPVAVAFGDGASEATLALLTPRFGSSRHVIALVTDATGERRVVKTPRVPTDDVQIAREAAGLATVADHRDRAPRLVADTVAHGHRWLVQTHVDGRPLTRSDIRREPVEWFARCQDWLAAMPTAGAGAPGSDGRVDRLLAPALASVRVLTGAAADHLVADAERAIAELRDVHLPVVAEHGDFRPPNVLVTPTAGIAAVDWELAEPAGMPLHDLLFLHAYVVGIAPERRRELDALVDDAARALSIDADTIDALYVSMLVRQLANSSNRGIAGGSQPWPAVDVARSWADRIGPVRAAEAS